MVVALVVVHSKHILGYDLVVLGTQMFHHLIGLAKNDFFCGTAHELGLIMATFVVVFDNLIVTVTVRRRH